MIKLTGEEQYRIRQHLDCIDGFLGAAKAQGAAVDDILQGAGFADSVWPAQAVTAINGMLAVVETRRNQLKAMSGEIEE